MRATHLTLAMFCLALPMVAQAAYWNLFNIEGESAVSAQYVTYTSLSDMLNDTNRIGVFTPNAFNAGRNIVGSGSNGVDYWNLFNIEGESAVSAQYVTYTSLSDMLNDTNRIGVFTPNAFNAGRNIVGSGSDEFRSPPNGVPEPGTFALAGVAFALLGWGQRLRRASPARPQ